MTSLLKETHVWNKALCLYFSFPCFPGGKWQMSVSRVGLSAPLSPAVTFWRFYRDLLARHLPRHSAEILWRDTATEIRLQRVAEIRLLV